MPKPADSVAARTTGLNSTESGRNGSDAVARRSANRIHNATDAASRLAITGEVHA